MKPQHGLSTAEAINRLIQFAQLNYKHRKELGENINLKHLDAVLHNSHWPFPTQLPKPQPSKPIPFNPQNHEDAPW
jgi:hypothetical protein